MFGKRGFTLIELLVVMAIIAILASIVAPRMIGWIGRARMTRAVAEIRNADLALTKMLADADRKSVAHLFTSPTALGANVMQLAYNAVAQGDLQRASQIIYSTYTDLFYELLRRGKDADTRSIVDLDLDPKVKLKLGTSYMDLGYDSWGNKYQFYPGPTPAFPAPQGFRSHREPDDPLDLVSPYRYDANAKQRLDALIRGNPQADYNGQWGGPLGFPAPRDLNVYMYSYGDDAISSQCMNFWNPNIVNYTGDGGDDVNNWDPEGGWGWAY